MKNTKERNKGITLVALVITIIILLILAGITINSLTGSGLFEKAKEAKIITEEREQEETDKIEKYSNEISKYVDGTRNDLESTVLYPGGTKDNPATIHRSERIEIDNPYKRNNVYVRVEVFYKGKWGEPGIIYDGYSRMWNKSNSNKRQ